MQVLDINVDRRKIDDFVYDDFRLKSYKSRAAVAMDMAV